MKIKGLIDEDFVNYKKPSMYIAFPKCSFKCDKECGRAICQNSALIKEKDIEIDIEYIVKRYLDNSITKAIVCSGLEPFDTADDLFKTIYTFRKYTKDPIIIYTGYTKDELENGKTNIANKLIKTIYQLIIEQENIIIKYGRFIPNSKTKYNDILGVILASDNQFVEKY